MAKSVGPQERRSVCVRRYHPTLASSIVDLDQAREYIFFLKVLGAANMKEALEISGSLALSDKSLNELKICNPGIRGWISWYGHFYKTQLRPRPKRIDAR